MNSVCCQGRFLAYFNNDGSVLCKHLKCTNTFHFKKPKLSEEMKSYILLNMLEEIPNYQIQIRFMKKINFNICRHEINNLKFKNKVCNPIRRQSSDLLYISNFINEYNHSLNTFS